MWPSRFKEEQIITILRKQETGAAMPVPSSPLGGSPSTRCGRTVRLATYRQRTLPSLASLQRNGAGCCARWGASRPVPLHRCTTEPDRLK